LAYNFLIVDDERLSRSYIKDLVLNYEPDAGIYEAASAKVAIPILENGGIDILFLDIRMSETDGFGLLNAVSHRNFDLVFITAHSEYAIKAIKEGAVDYLLKPIKIPEFEETLRKLLEKRKHPAGSHNPGIAVSENSLDQKLTISHQQGFRFVVMKNILYLKADNSYTTLFLTNGEKITTSKPINKFEALLDANWFFRIHKSYIANTWHLKELISRQGENIALMKNGDKLAISRYRLKEFLDFIRSRPAN